MPDERPRYVCRYCGDRAAYRHETKVAEDRPARIRLRCRSCRRSWSSHEEETWFGLRAGARHVEGLSAYQLFFRTIVDHFLRVGLPEAIRGAREAAGVSAPTASRWIKQLSGSRYRTLVPIVGPHHELLRDCLVIYRGRFAPPRAYVPEPADSSSGRSRFREAFSLLIDESDHVWRSLVRARTMAAIVAGIPSERVLVDEGVGSEWRPCSGVRGPLFVPSWLDRAFPEKNLYPASTPVSALRVAIESLGDLESIVRNRTPDAWWQVDDARQWLFHLARIHREAGIGVRASAGPGPDLLNWVDAHPPPPPIDADRVAAVLRDELSALRWWMGELVQEPDFDGQHGWSYWVIGKHRLLRFVVSTSRRVVGSSAALLGRALPGRFAIRLRPEDKRLGVEGLFMGLIPRP